MRLKPLPHESFSPERFALHEDISRGLDRRWRARCAAAWLVGVYFLRGDAVICAGV
ncbi:MAG: hypothetical protein JSS44_01640 [Proteobacteria bacterium]|nr:hypothetical protein [Pseudomonadota bacterium]MBS0462975.1 hypothetical protein [Pseudomonadota bacterium]MBS0463911.1 hypothetical protein [Pseudomonadota bacterium]